LHLIGIDSPAQRNRAHIRQAGLLLSVNTNMIAVNIVGNLLFNRGIELEPKAVLEFTQKAVGGPPVTQEKEFETRTLAVFS
jgi:hypothetical protein